MNVHLRSWDANRLIRPRDQVHLDTRLRAIPHGAMREAIEIDPGAELAIDAQQQVLVERRSDAQRIVVGEQQTPLRLHQVDAKQQRVALREARADVLQERRGAGRVEVPDVRSEERDQRAAGDGGRRLAQSGIVSGLMRDDVHVRQHSDGLCGRRQGGRRHIDQMRRSTRSARSGQTRKQDFQLFAAPGPEFDDVGHRGGAPEDVGAVRREQARFRARDRVPRQAADRVEQRRPEVVVEIA